MLKRGTRVRLAVSCAVVLGVMLSLVGSALGGSQGGAKTESSTPATAVTTADMTTSSQAGRTILGLHSHDVSVWKSKVPSSEWGYARNIRLVAAWADIEGSGKGFYDWARTDSMVNEALSVGVNSIILTLDKPLPFWARNASAPGDPSMAPPLHLSDWYDFCKAVATHYKGYIDLYQIWNEPGWDLDAPPAKQGIVYFSGYCDLNYMGLMRAGYQGIKAADPEAFVSSGSLINGLYRNPTDYTNFNALLAGTGQDLSMKVTADKNIVAERPMYFNYQNKWDGGHVQAGIPEPKTSWYLAEGTTNPGFDEWITLQNPGDIDTAAGVTYMFPGGKTQFQQVGVPAHSRVTVDVNSVVGANKDVSAHITSGLPIVVERPMYFSYHNKWTGGSVDSAVTEPSPIWYLAEGTTNPGFEEWISLMNPDANPAKVTLTYMFKGGQTQQQVVDMPPTSRQTINVNEIVGPNKDVSTKVESTVPIIADRPMYFNYHGAWNGGDSQSGSTSAGTSWFLAEGTTRSNSADGYYEEWISIMNPGDAPANVNLTYMFPGGATQPGNIMVGAHSRETINVNEAVGPNKDVSVKLDSDNQVIVERPMYFKYRNAWTGGSVELGNRQSGQQWYFAEGSTRSGFAEWLTLQNPGAEEAHAVVTFQFSDGTTQNKNVTLPANSRTTVDVNNSVSIGTIADAVALHPYDYPEYWKDYYNNVVNICRNNGYPNTEVIITEIGWPHESVRAGFSPEGQRQALDGVGLGGLFAAGAKKVWIYEDIDDPTQTWAGEDSKHGLFDSNGNAEPAWNEYKKWEQSFPNYGNKPSSL